MKKNNFKRQVIYPYKINEYLKPILLIIELILLIYEMTYYVQGKSMLTRVC